MSSRNTQERHLIHPWKAHVIKKGWKKKLRISWRLKNQLNYLIGNAVCAALSSLCCVLNAKQRPVRSLCNTTVRLDVIWSQWSTQTETWDFRLHNEVGCRLLQAGSLCHYGPSVNHMHNMWQLPLYLMGRYGLLFAHCCCPVCECSLWMPVCAVIYCVGPVVVSVYLPTRRNQGKRS